MDETQGEPSQKNNVGLFVTCLVDLFRPSVGFAALKLLEQSGCIVSVPDTQTCCGQPAYNSGDRADAIEIAKNTIAAFEDFDYVVAPSGSCAGMISHHYPRLFEDDKNWGDRARKLAGRTFELVSFLTDVRKMTSLPETITAPEGMTGKLKITYHDSCAGYREMNVHAQPRQLLSSVDNLELTEMDASTECCGFGGTFCIKYPEVSSGIVDRKLTNARATGADVLVGGDLGCLLNMGGRLAREGQDMDVRHVAELLVGDFDTPPIVKDLRSPDAGPKEGTS